MSISRSESIVPMGARQWSARAGIAVAGVVAGVAAVLVARDHPDLSIVGDDTLASAAQLVAGWALIAAGLAHSARRSDGRSGTLLVVAGFMWFVVEAANPEIGSAAFFTAGLLLAAACPALIVHAALAHATARLASRAEVAVVAAGYATCLGVAGIAATVLNDPAAHGCLDCPRNLAYVAGSTGTADAVTRAGLWLVCAWAVAAVVMLVRRDVRASVPLRRLATPMLAPAALYAALAGAAAAHGIPRGFQSNDPTDRRLWVAQALALVAVAAGSAWDRVRSARMRSELGDLVVELDALPAGRGVRDALARSLGEPALTLVYRGVSGSGWIDADGQPAEPPAGATELAGIAAVSHRPGALQDPELVRDIARAARPALEHERLQAQLKAQLAELRLSRARVVETGDAERRRLEADLHDGAQQRIVALALDLRLARRQLARVNTDYDVELAAAEDDLRLAVAELREVAHGLHPHTLQESGLTAALLALAEGEPRLAIEALPQERADTAAEFAAYQVVAETLRRVPGGDVAVRGLREGPRLLIEVEADAAPSTLVTLEDRIGALDGRLTVEHGTRTTLRAELPCGS